MTDNTKPYVYKRENLATSIANGLAGGGLTDYRAGLFLTAPRRTGKTTFLLKDLIPKCLSLGWHCVYVDLWSDRDTDPSKLITAAIANEISQNQNKAKSLIKTLGIKKISLLKSIEWDFNKPTLPDGITMSDALEILHKATGKLIILIIDEAQHALTSESGINSMFSLKAARDHLTQSVGIDGLRLVLTGSSRDKLAQLVVKKDQPFFGSSVTTFPLLDKLYAESLCSWVNLRLAGDNQLNSDDIYDAFELVGHRPQMLMDIISEVALNLGDAPNLGQLLKRGALNLRNSLWDEYEISFGALNAIQKSVLEALIDSTEKKQIFSPYSEPTLKNIESILTRHKSKTKSNSTNIQAALDVLRAKDLIWKSSRGNYALEDAGFVEWFKNTQTGEALTRKL
jgi:hypothetical protein